MDKRFIRMIHLDGHISPLIENMGSRFDADVFEQTLREEKASAVTVFAKCHHGYTTYPSKVGTMNPHLTFDLLGEEIGAAHRAGVRANIYIPIAWSTLDVEEHPEWCAYEFSTKAVCNNHYDFSASPDDRIPDGCWINLCPAGPYGDYLLALTREICERYRPVDGLFFDITLNRTSCVCPDCVRGMKALGMDPENEEDAKAYYQKKRNVLFAKLHAILRETSPDADFFLNGSCSAALEGVDYRSYHEEDTHFELEEMPSWGGDYDAVQYKARYLEKYGKPIVGMTGKFHLGWGEFGGFKTVRGLRYEAANCLSLGIGLCIGDQIHPYGTIEEEAKHLISETFRYIKEREDLCFPSESVTDLGVIYTPNEACLAGLNALLLQLKADYVFLHDPAMLAACRCVVLPPDAVLSEEMKQALDRYLARGGRLLVIGDAVNGYPVDGIEPITPSEFDVDYIRCHSVCASSFVTHHPAFRVRAEGAQILAGVEEPFFSRTYAHYCSHLHAPTTGTLAPYPAACRVGNVVYMAHDIPTEYGQYGQIYLRDYFSFLLEEVYPDRLLRVTGLFASGRVRIRRQREAGQYIVHLLYAQPVHNGCATVIDDTPPVFGITLTLDLPEKITEARLFGSGEPLTVSQKDGKTVVRIPSIRSDALLILRYQ